MNVTKQLSQKNKYKIDGLINEPEVKSSLIKAITTRRTVRRYQKKMIPREQLESLLRLSTHAPSACNRRGWRFILIEDQEKLDWLYAKGGAAFIPKVKQAVLACYFGHTDNTAWRDVEQSSAAAIAYFQLLAHAEGIGSCWVCHLPPRGEVRRFFKIPSNYTPVALLTVGYYVEDMDVIERHVDNEELLSVDQWHFLNAPNKDVVGVKLTVKKILRNLYYHFPKREWLRNLTHRFEKKFNNHD